MTTAQPILDVLPIPGLTIRYTVPQDAEWLKAWLSDPGVKDAFPMASETEVDDAVRRWISFSRIRASLTVELDGRPVGLATLYIQTYRRLAHQTEYRNRGIGSFLLSSIMKLAKQHFHIELIHLQVYQDNRAIDLYKKFGFVEFGCQTG
jgi:putative acetyltransferase